MSISLNLARYVCIRVYFCSTDLLLYVDICYWCYTGVMHLVKWWCFANLRGSLTSRVFWSICEKRLRLFLQYNWSLSITTYVMIVTYIYISRQIRPVNMQSRRYRDYSGGVNGKRTVSLEIPTKETPPLTSGPTDRNPPGCSGGNTFHRMNKRQLWDMISAWWALIIEDDIWKQHLYISQRILTETKERERE